MKTHSFATGLDVGRVLDLRTPTVSFTFFLGGTTGTKLTSMEG